MNMNLVTEIAQQTAAPQQQQSGGLMGLLPMIVVFGVLIFFMWHSQKKEQKRRQAMIDGVKVGDRVCTIGGIFGEVVGVSEQAFTVKIAENTKVEIAKSAVNAAPAAGNAASK